MSRLTEERAATHGPFEQTAATAGVLGDFLLNRAVALSPQQKHALVMIGVKLARILHGDHDHIDHWADIAGYAELECARLQKAAHPLVRGGFEGEGAFRAP